MTITRAISNVITICNCVLNFGSFFYICNLKYFQASFKSKSSMDIAKNTIHPLLQDVYFFQCCFNDFSCDSNKCSHRTFLLFGHVQVFLGSCCALQMFCAKLKIIGISTKSTSFTSTFNASEMLYFHLRACFLQLVHIGLLQDFFQTNQQCMKANKRHSYTPSDFTRF